MNFCWERSFNVCFAAETNVFRRRADEHVEDAGLDTEVVNLHVVVREMFDGNFERNGLRFAGIESDALEGAEALDGLVGGADALVRVELGYFGAGAIA